MGILIKSVILEMRKLIEPNLYIVVHWIDIYILYFIEIADCYYFSINRGKQVWDRKWWPHMQEKFKRKDITNSLLWNNWTFCKEVFLLWSSTKFIYVDKKSKDLWPLQEKVLQALMNLKFDFTSHTPYTKKWNSFYS